MFVLVPEWAHHYGEFWKAIRVRNLWFIRLRYFAVITLLGFLIVGETILNFQFTIEQVLSISLTSFFILSYNIVLHATRKYVGCIPEKFNCLHLSLIQMILDLITLMLLVYYIGVIESPLNMFFIFHMIISSLILPGAIVYIIAGIISLSFSTLVILQRYHLIESHPIKGLFENMNSHIFTYDILFKIVFTFRLFVSVYIANKIALQLYQREQQLKLSFEKLNEVEVEKQKHIICIIHEIKTPVAAVSSIIDIILQKFVGPISEIIESKLLRAKLRADETHQLLNNVL